MINIYVIFYDDNMVIKLKYLKNLGKYKNIYGFLNIWKYMEYKKV